MLVWLASFPRSGNTLLRIMLNRVFELETWSVYDDKEFSRSEAMTALIGHRSHGGKLRELIGAARESEELVLVKTHNMPPPRADRTIYIVRDGRSSCVSFAHYESRGKPKGAGLSITESVLGAHWVGPWSRHVTAWALRDRPDTLLLRYEDLARMDETAIASIAAHIGRDPVRSAQIDFEELRRTDPNFFRAGNDAGNIAELEATCPALYDIVNGDVARHVGYPPETRATVEAATAEMARCLAEVGRAAPPAPRRDRLAPSETLPN